MRVSLAFGKQILRNLPVPNSVSSVVNFLMYSSPDYLERVYAGVLGKIIGVYLGRPFEGWTQQRILSELGEIWDYQHERLGVPLVVADDDISGTFTILRALPDHVGSADLTA
jgi:ADP-ribosylglycohydrolase